VRPHGRGWSEAAAWRVDDAVTVRAAGGQIVERRGPVVAGELGPEVHGGRVTCATWELELALETCTLERSVTLRRPVRIV
jgi:hypothetical protein